MGQNMQALIDPGAQISAISESMVKILGLGFLLLEMLLHLEGSASLEVPYLGYTEPSLDVPKLSKFDFQHAE